LWRLFSHERSFLTPAAPGVRSLRAAAGRPYPAHGFDTGKASDNERPGGAAKRIMRPPGGTGPKVISHVGVADYAGGLQRPAQATPLRRGHRAPLRSTVGTYYRGVHHTLWEGSATLWRTRTPKSTPDERFPTTHEPEHLVQGYLAAVSGGPGARAPWQHRPRHT